MPRTENNTGTRAAMIAVAMIAAGVATADVVSTRADQFGVYSLDRIDLAQRVRVEGDIGSRKRVKVGHDASIVGDVYTADGTDFDQRVSHAGEVFGESAWYAPGSPARPGIAAGDADWSVDRDGVANITPGSFGKARVGERATLRFIAGSYGFSDFRSDHEARFVFDTSGGDILLSSMGKVDFDQRTMFSITGPGRVEIHAGGDIKVGHDSTIAGSFYSHDGRIHIKQRGTVRGTLYAADGIKIEHDSRIIGTAMGTVPGPASLAACAVTFAVFGGHRRR